MSRTARLWKGAGLLTLAGVLLSGVLAHGDDGPPLASQLNDLGRQALAQGATAMAQTFFQKALALDPGNADATRGLKDTKAAQGQVVHVAFQDSAPAQPPAEPTTPPPAPGDTAPAAGVPSPVNNNQPVPGSRSSTPPAAAGANQPPTSSGPRATLEESEREDNVARQQLTSDVEQRLAGGTQPGRFGAARSRSDQSAAGPKLRPLRHQRSRERPFRPGQANPGPDAHHGSRRRTNRRRSCRAAAAAGGLRRSGPAPSPSSRPTRTPSSR